MNMNFEIDEKKLEEMMQSAINKKVTEWWNKHGVKEIEIAIGNRIGNVIDQCDINAMVKECGGKDIAEHITYAISNELVTFFAQRYDW